ncbi:MAG TPA: ABC transporter substrate-binding protein [Stellaceae bacterium]|nr:ABC transporter substrate-binding protein [Stellaceae bacterium]
MRRRTFLRLGLGLGLSGTLIAGASRRAWAVFEETPYFAAAVAAGKLPPVSERVPRNPALAELETLGRPGGDLRMLMASPKDTRLMTVYGYARLVAYTPALALQPDILERVDVVEQREFTFRLRPGHKWSDGKPFTTEDFRFWFEDVASNPELSQAGLPTTLLPHGERPKFMVIDRETVQYSWSRPNPLFLPALAGADPLFIFAPAHYLKKLHQKYADKAKLAAMVKDAGVRNWAALYVKHANMYRNNNPKLPTLEPWVLRTKPPAERIVFERNPYYYRADGAGHQLPYLDRVILTIANSRIIPAKTGAGESDLQARYLSFDDYTFLKAGEAANNYGVRLWRTGPGSQLAFYPNLNVDDPVWRNLLHDVRFRRALSLAVDRHEINQVMYFGLAIESQNTVLPQSPLYRPHYRSAWASYDLAASNRLLDEIGLKRNSAEGLRKLPDGRTADIIVEDSGESSDKTDLLELVRDSWRQVGVRLFSRPMQLTLFRRRVFSGQTLMSLDKGIENGLATAEMSPWEFAPTSQQQLEWPKWGNYTESNGRDGEPPDIPGAIRLKKLYEAWLSAPGREQHARLWHEILELWADEVYSIGTVAGVQQPVVVNDKLRNVPKDGMYNWDPGAHFGIYKPDGFWFDSNAASAALTRPR